jgi:stage V sporulation protein S
MRIERVERVVRVSKGSTPSQVAGAIAGILREDGSVEIRAMGAMAIDRMVKATAVARRFMQAEGCELSLSPRWETVGELTAIIFEVKRVKEGVDHVD